MGLKKHHFVLVHGAGHASWCWMRVTPVLEKAGHRVTAIDLASAGESPAVKAEDVTSFKQYNQPLEDLFQSFPDGEKVILVGHSLGGMNLTYMSELFPKKISVAVYLTAFMPAPGLDLLEMAARDPSLTPPPSETDREYTYNVKGGLPTSEKFQEAFLKENLYNKCSPEDTAIAVARCTVFPPLHMTLKPIQGTEENYGSVPRVYVLALQDKAILPILARKLIELNPPKEVIELDADHSLFFCAADEVVKLLTDAAAKYDS